MDTCSQYANKIHEIDENLQQPEKFQVELRPFQLTTIEHMKKYEKMNFTDNVNNQYPMTINTDKAILANRAGSGKTLTVLGLIQKTLSTPIEYNLHGQYDFYSYKKDPPSGRYINTTLIYYSFYTKDHWTKELNRTGMKYLFASRLNISSDFENYDIVLVSCKDSSHMGYGNLIFKRLIVDNADMIKVSQNNQVKSYFRWYLTSEYKLMFTRGKFVFQNSVYSTIIVVKCKSHLYDYDLHNYQLSLASYVPDYPSRILYYNKTRLLKLLDEQRYLDFINLIGIQPLSRRQIVEIFDQNVSESRLATIKSNINSIECPICYDSSELFMLSSCCQNIFCARCVVNVLSSGNKCPCCRQRDVSLNPIVDEDAVIFNKRIDVLILLIQKFISEGNKITVFVDSNTTDYYRICDKFGYSIIERSSGSYINTLRKIERFNNDPGIKVFIYNNKEQYYKGVDLPQSDVMIISFQCCIDYNITVRRAVNVTNQKNIKVIKLTQTGWT